jgi:isopentenyl diphosphate isomerase/L-lactate dehydrogenase-like FMN-dependent dehydrogenase
VSSMFDPSVTWDDVARIRDLWQGLIRPQWSGPS